MSVDVDGTHPYERLCEDDAVYKYEKLLRMQSRACSGQRFTAICILASTITVIIVLLCFVGGNDDVWAGISNLDLNVWVETKCGRIEGELIDDGFVFKGLPYALPPTGKMRFAKSELASTHKGCWKGKFKSKSFGNKCLQQNPLTGVIEGDENCLFLNVFTPTLDSHSKLPVVVYVHGGDFQWGSGHELGLSPDIRLAKEFDLVFVTFNFRLSLFGSFVFDFGSNESLNGNYGIHDQILALKWVNENIINFGGDNEKVTVFAHGSGATSFMALLASNYTKGLFQRLWLSSIKLVDYKPLNEAKKLNEKFLKSTNCSSLNCLLKMDSREIFEIYLKSRENSSDYLTIDNDILHWTRNEMWKTNSLNDVPLLIGSTAQEETIEFPTDSSSMNILQFKKFVRQMNLINDKNLDLFTHLYYNESNPQLSILTALSDKNRICPINYITNQAAILSSSIYRYIVTGRLSRVIQLPLTRDLGEYSFNSLDLIAFFGLLERYIEEPSEEDLMLKDVVQSMAVDFIRSGSMQMSSWKGYPRKLAEISTRIKLVGFYNREKCQFWRHIARD